MFFLISYKNLIVLRRSSNKLNKHRATNQLKEKQRTKDKSILFS